VNCGASSSTRLCVPCQTLTTCHRCKRSLPPHCFTSCNGATNNICQACRNKKNKKKKHTTTAVCDIVSETMLPTYESDTTVDGFLNANVEHIRETVEHALAQHRSVRVQFRIDILFRRHTDNHTAMGYFSTRPEVINSSTREIDIDAVIANYNSQIDNFNSRGSSYQVDRIMKFVISITKFRPFHGGCPCRR